MAIVSNIFGIFVFAGIGYLLSTKLSPPKRQYYYIFWILGIVIAGWIGVSTILIGFDDFGIYSNSALQGLLLGLVVGWLIRAERKQYSEVAG